MIKKLTLICILLLYLVSRLFEMGKIPSSVYWDEASIGYNAYSVLVSGQDEWGESYPLHFRAFGEFKLPVYIYSVVPFVSLFGLNEVSVRLPSIIYGFGFIILIYLIGKKLFNGEEAALLSAFIACVIPWLIPLTRIGYEAVAGLFFYTVMFYVFMSEYSLTKKLIGLFTINIICLYTYNSLRILAPLTLIVYVFMIFKDKFTKKLLITLSALVLISSLSVYPIYKVYKSDFGLSRANSLKVEGTFNQKISIYTKNYLSHFSPKFLFFTGDANKRSQFGGYGQLYLISAPVVLFGLYELFRSKNEKMKVLIFLLLVSPIPASITKESPHALRSLTMIMPLILIIAYGIYNLAMKKPIIANVARFLVIFIYLISFESYMVNYISNYNQEAGSDFQYMYKVININSEASNQNLYITDSFAQPYIFTLFYKSINPQSFISTKEVNTVDQWGFSTIKSFGNYEYYSSLPDNMENGSLIYSDRILDSSKYTMIDIIKDLGGNPVIWVYKN